MKKRGELMNGIIYLYTEKETGKGKGKYQACTSVCMMMMEEGKDSIKFIIIVLISCVEFERCTLVIIRKKTFERRPIHQCFHYLQNTNSADGYIYINI